MRRQAQIVETVIINGDLRLLHDDAPPPYHFGIDRPPI
jgi:hypothetical protein